MKNGKKSIESLDEHEKSELLKEIVNLCIEYAGDFSSPVIRLLVKNKLVNYGK